MRVIVLGTGRVGSAMVRDLAPEGWELTAVDASPEALEGLPARTQTADLSDPARVTELVRGHDLVIGAVPGPMGYATAAVVIEAGVPLVDISFFEQDPYGLDAAARERGVPVLVDCGISPGCGNLLLGHALATFDEVERFTCLVGGLPVERRWPWEYRAVFSPIDVIAEYTRPARLVSHGREVVRPALSEVERLDLPGVGTVEAFNTDGLRTLLRLADRVPFMKEKTLRYPGHAERMLLLRETGLFGEEPIEVGGARVRPIDLTASLLFPAWQLPEGEEDLTVMRVEVEGRRDGRRARRRWDLLDRFDRATGTTSMARTTGYTCTAVARAFAAGLVRGTGVLALEDLGGDDAFSRFVLERLAERGVVFEASEPEPA